MDVLSAITLLGLFGLVALAAGVESRAAFANNATWEHHL